MNNYLTTNKSIKELALKPTLLICVSKMRSDQEVLEIYHEGQRHFAENKVQELTRKHQTLPADIQWHMIGRLQTNKVKYIIPFVEYIHSVDRIDLAKAIDKSAKKHNKIQKVLIQFNIAKEETKSGFLIDETYNVFQALLKLENLDIVGLMMMAPYIDDMAQVESYFIQLSTLLDDLNQHFNLNMKELSMGMSHDYIQAINAGATMLRIGSALFDDVKTNE